MLPSLSTIIIFYRTFFFFFNDTPTTEIYTLSLHDALPISGTDYTPAAGTLTFAPGEVSKLISVPITDNAIDNQKDRKSTRLNSSHANISYAVFCLKKKKKNLSNTNKPAPP